MSTRSENGFTLLELLIVVAIVGIIASLAVAGVLRARMAANEASAIGSMRTINSAQQAYAASCANGFYASSLLILASSPPEGPSFISPDLGLAAAATKSGYVLQVFGASDGIVALDDACNPLGTAANLVSAYYATGHPTSLLTGSRYFWTNTSATIYFDRDNPIAHTQGLTGPPPPAQPLESAP